MDYMSGLNAFFWILVDGVDLLNLPTVTVKTVKVDPQLTDRKPGLPMAILQLASSKIPAELMARLKKFTELSGVNQSAAIRQAIEQFLDNAESTGLSTLTSGEGSLNGSELVARADAVDVRLLEIESRLMELERSTSAAPEPIVAVVEPKPVPPPPPLTKPLADGGQWLLTNEAWKLAKKRGCRRGYASFAKHAKAHPDRIVAWGLRFLGSNKPGDHRRASFQDLLWEQ